MHAPRAALGRRERRVGCLSALSSFGVARCESLLPALAFRAVAGTAMPGMYMPGLQSLTFGVEGSKRARVAAWYTSSFTISVSVRPQCNHQCRYIENASWGRAHAR
jgi:hypothetical protein